MSSRLIALILFVFAGTTLAQTESTTQAAEQAASEATQAVENAEQAVEEMAAETEANAETMVEETVEEATETTEQAAENAEQAVEEMAAETEANAETMVEEAVEEATETTEQAAENAEQAVEEMVEETEANAETMAEEAVEEATETTEQAVEEMVEETETAATTEQATEQTSESMAATSSSDVEAKVAACAACHGADGNSVIPQNPKLAGQVPGFIADQLAKFKSGERDNAIMTAQVANLTEQDMKDIDAFYASQQPQLGAISEDMQELALEGQKIYRGGEPSMSISACMSCHGPSGNGIPIRFPKVSGQHIEYLEQQLLAYKTGSRVSNVMNPIAFRLSEQQIKALSAYMHALK